MDDPACKRLFSRPRMVEDLLRGFAARDWSGDLDFASLTPLPASYVSHDLRQRHGDLVRFRDDRWLYVVLLLEFPVGGRPLDGGPHADVHGAAVSETRVFA